MRSTLLPLLITATAAAHAQQPSIFPAELNTPQTHHDGEIWLTFLAEANETFPYALTVANSAPGTRLDWHSHPEGQRLVVTEGKGYYQERGQLARIMRPGMVFECPPGVEHFHAASPDQGVVYLAIYPEAPTQWGAPVTDEEYAAVPAQDSAFTAEEVLALSRDKWRWMADKDTARLAALFDDRAKFVHMSGTWNKPRELEIIGSGSIWYKRADVHDAAVEVAGDVATLWNRITLATEARGNDVSNEFTVTEVYRRGGGGWKLFGLTFSSVRDTHEIEGSGLLGGQ